MAKKQLPSVGLKAQALRQKLPPATAPSTPRGGGRGAPLQLVLPPDLVQDLKVKAAQANTTVRALVLKALQKAGYAVPPEEIGDRRRK